MADAEVYEASDEASEGEFDRSLSLWKGWSSVDQTDGEDFKPIPIDLYTAASLGQYDTVRSLIKNWYVDSPFSNKPYLFKHNNDHSVDINACISKTDPGVRYYMFW